MLLTHLASSDRRRVRCARASPLTDDAGCDIGHTGCSPASIGGGDMKTLTPGNSFIENCHIWDFARTNRC